MLRDRPQNLDIERLDSETSRVLSVVLSVVSGRARHDSRSIPADRAVRQWFCGVDAVLRCRRCPADKREVGGSTPPGPISKKIPRTGLAGREVFFL